MNGTRLGIVCSELRNTKGCLDAPYGRILDLLKMQGNLLLERI